MIKLGNEELESDVYYLIKLGPLSKSLFRMMWTGTMWLRPDGALREYPEATWMRWTDFSKLILYTLETQEVENAPLEKLRMYLVAYNGVVRRMIYSGKQFVCG